MDKIRKILIISSDQKLKEVLDFCFDGWGYEVYLQKPSEKKLQSYDLERIKQVSPDVIVVDVQSARSAQLDICSRLKNDFVTAFVPVITLINKRHLRNQLLHVKQGVDDYLIKPPDPLDLRMRIEIALRRAHHSINANTLTSLPGARILEDIVKDNFKKKQDFSFCYVDIDNFKSFNDLYGYQRGDKVIVQTAYMLQLAITKAGGSQDFISHIGGDDFAFITTLGNYDKVCSYFIQLFDNIIPFHYSKEDREAGFVVTRDRSRKVREMPLMSVSLAVVNKGVNSTIENMIQLNERVSEVKKFLKKISKSCYMADRRDAKLSENQSIQINKKRNNKIYKPLGQILLDKNIVSSEQLDEALNIHWRKGISTGRVLKELGFVTDSELKEALDDQKINFINFIEKDMQKAG
ncbi:MAG: diguanylate cyclase [Candidatus Omnitrophica bacterium]|nr:diguanylate cyclase [Candidatus Omnitrophota bacterium]MCF7877618.1 diguanylate cyclase [Candidatus Omnitrophota bacterium]MCF7878132.1 diguanylate cyclase [Candidatus Omnitrophota bacterium]MCF7893305.1 diguanylate cyclase [Candidatus Omnitrophota bacterium]